ncbi:Hypothetical predicted protein [Mytilus galloprovincialis]|uniref:Mab-21-like HhH/H2TH-like domain-containing protein n=1 Tax=Mytilus galloprovincialis TaxID=29158 RepID=A0A8B6C9W1_MYTGA|nr:Hypothetical predicted protein [Mytilus galloprovincialis]
MNSEDKNLSLQFYDYLCNIVGSEDVVRTRREIFTSKDLVENTTFATSISSGSKAEGLDLKGSDYDMMYLFNFVRVYESLNAAHSNPYKIPLVMDTSDINPGFTKLKLVNKLYINNPMIHVCGETVGEKTYISSKRFRERHLPNNMVIHGPCHSTAGGEYDGAICFRCNEWVTAAQQWIHRSRTTWPHYTLVSAAVQYGVLFVPIGCKNSPKEDLQWRISFSVTEKLLIHSFTHTQLFCYALLKIILKDIIKPRHGDLLCSYFLKTIMFWLSEEISPLEWIPESMNVCVLNCIRRLIYCVEYKTCLHYFIPEYNLFEERFTEEEHKTLMDTLKSIYESPWTSIFDTSPFQTIRLESTNRKNMILSVSELSCLTYIQRVMCTSPSNSVLFKRLMNGNDRIFKRKMDAFLLSLYSGASMQSLTFYNLNDGNNSFYKQYKSTLFYFKIGLQSDYVSSWLMLASLFYKCKRYWECLDILHFCLSCVTPNKIYLHVANNLTEQTIFKKMKQRFGLLITFKYLITNFLNFRKPFGLLPNELKPLIRGNRIDFPPVVYANVLSFLCYHHMRDYRKKLNALSDLELTVKERYFVLKTANECLDIAKALT